MSFASNVPPKDMRSWIAELEAAGELIRIDKPVDPLTEMGSLLYQSREKALLFEKLPHGWRSLGQAPANVRHAALAFGTNEEALVPFVADRMGRGMAPVRVSDGPVKEMKLGRDKLNLAELPVHIAGQRDGGPVTLAFCWTHWRREFVKIDEGGPAPIAHEALERIAALYAIESRIRGRSADERRVIRQAETRPLVEALKTWLENRLVAVSDKSTIADVIRYGFNHWHGLVRFLDDGRIEMDTNSVERAMRPIALNRKNSLFAGHDQGAINWACIASLIETAKLHGVDPKPYLADILTKLVNGWPMAKVDELLPWTWAQQNKVSLAA